MQEYVLGFAFTRNNRVALIRKTKPDWQKGFLNGIGGKLEPGESHKEAMVREFREETGINLPPTRWNYRGIIHGSDFIVYIFSYKSCTIEKVKTMTEEEVLLFGADIPRADMLPNVFALIQLCKNKDKSFFTLQY